ncbi:LemA family protein [Afifella marina DSM 2698]|uniref:LemA protein n=1 Tax=Afifella marina DSM 2698 TaxID=1120955 RepID=A0A1G5NQ01_AFIMA|nr:LemA family protein [Afifella marina]MBK1624567.1 LemA family protein [Afifella marina DSM 2698]MBK1627460.1 LemA family protein [Afifella marina]MBK5918518.1 LemA family protein [Afifella marina]RAI20671.1 LemA family protein [Afifella marina DSM 2698]SCZ39038.1 LemA protein [Afifella marina DSM 2698]
MRPLTGLRIAFIGFVAIFLASCGVNTIPTYEEQAKAAWSQVENQYQRRADLVPNLVETVKGFARQEKDVLTSVVEARSKATQTNLNVDPTDPEAMRRYQEAQGELGAALGRLLAITENYPDLKSNQNFLALQSQLEGTENRIAVARRDYIEAVRKYNTELKTFPGRLWAATLYSGYEPMANFETAPENANAPQVDFGGSNAPGVNFNAPANETAPANENQPANEPATGTGN